MTFFGMAFLTAIGTFVLAVFAVVTAWYARKAFAKQSQELELVRVQLDDQRKASAAQAEELRQAAADREREAQERHRAQAVQVYLWETFDPDSAQVVAHVRNTSRQPVYDLRLAWFPDPGTGTAKKLATRVGDLLPDGEFKQSSAELGPYASCA